MVLQFTINILIRAGQRGMFVLGRDFVLLYVVREDLH